MSISNPFESPEPVEERQPVPGTKQAFSYVRLGFFLVNFGIALFFLYACIYNFILADYFAPFFGAMFAFIPSLAMAVYEWKGYVKDDQVVERKLGKVMFIFFAFWLFASVSTLGEILVKEDVSLSVGIVLFLVCMFSFSFYLAACGYYRVWYRKEKDSLEK